MEASLYEYEKIDLAKDAIRLCRLFRRPQEPQSPPVIECELFQSYLHQAKGVPYEALSYTWGYEDEANESTNHTIIMNGKNHHVRKNLFNALSSIRLDHRDRIVWIDALCIDQDNPHERNHQVAQMAQTYECAKRVLVWLGIGNERKNSVIKWMSALDKYVSARPNFCRRSSSAGEWVSELQDHGYFAVKDGYGPNDGNNNRWPRTMRILKMPELDFREEGSPLDTGEEESQQDFKEEEQDSFPSLTEMELKEMPNLYHAVWFTRIWVIQEAAKARSALVMYDRYSVQSSTFALIPRLFDFEVPEGTQAVLDILPGPLRMESWFKNERSLCTLLAKFGSSCEASDERDKVYALLGIASDTESSKRLLPEYEADQREVIKRTAAFLIEAKGDTCNPDLWTSHLPQWTMEQFLNALPQPGVSFLQWTLRQKLPEAIALIAERGETSDSMNEPKWPGPSDFRDDSPCSLVWRVVASKPQYQKLLGVILLRPDIDPNIKHNQKTPLVQAARSRHWPLFHRLLGDHRVKRWAMQECSEFLWEKPEPKEMLNPEAMVLMIDTLRLFLLNLAGLARDGLLGAIGKDFDHPLYYADQELLSLQDGIYNLIDNDLESTIDVLNSATRTEARRLRFALAHRQSWPAQLKSSLVSDYIAAQWGLGSDLKDLWPYPTRECLLLLAVRLEDLPALSTLLGPKLSLNRYSLRPLLVVATVTRNVFIARMLLENGTNPNIPYTQGTDLLMPLQIAVMNRQMDMARLLLDHKADPNQESQVVLAPIEIAIALEDDAMVNLLRDYVLR
ncbi:hypothetical protein MCOR25_009866 [Pyricularia grisea]|nr:hypothetical protein MCOR25_009866 [Pyricularia grisea]